MNSNANKTTIMNNPIDAMIHGRMLLKDNEHIWYGGQGVSFKVFVLFHVPHMLQ
jgi:hypothetical protein